MDWSARYLSSVQLKTGVAPRFACGISRLSGDGYGNHTNPLLSGKTRGALSGHRTVTDEFYGWSYSGRNDRQQEDGSVLIPEVLQRYMGGKKIINKK